MDHPLAWNGSPLKLICTLCTCLHLVPTEPSKCSPKSSDFPFELTSSSSEWETEPDQVPTDSEKKSTKRRQRTTFSAHEVWAMERAFEWCVYLLRDDEIHLVHRLGIPAKSVRVSCQSFCHFHKQNVTWRRPNLEKEIRQIFRWSTRDQNKHFRFSVWANSSPKNGAYSGFQGTV